MVLEHWPRARELFEEAIELPPEQRSAFVARETAGEQELRALVVQLLAAEELEDEFLEPPTVQTAARLPLETRVEPDGTHIGSYELRGLIARGGMGAVYEAEQSDPRRRVALKLMRPGPAGSAAPRRFRDEIDLLARLKHPGIAAVHEAGVLSHGEGETPWFAMELVEGARPITRYAREEGLCLEERLELLLEVCAAVMHGHRRGVLHRDLKPANILVDRAGRAKVIDFGVAKAIDGDSMVADERTLDGELVGTLLYMSPEQIEGRREDVDTRADVYALGVVLYELLCDRRPHEIAGLPITQAGRILCREEPSPPSARVANLPEDLDWVCARALAKECGARYGTVAELAADLERFLAHEPVLAGPPSAAYHVRKFVRRHRVMVTAAALVGLAVVGGLIGTSVGILRAQAAEELAQRDRQLALEEALWSSAVVDYLVDFLGAPDPGREGRDVRVVEALGLAQASYAERFADSPVVQARIAGALGRVYHGLGLATEAEAELRRALETIDRLPAGPTGERSVILGQLGSVLLLAGRLDEAETVLREALRLETELAREDHPGLHRAQIGWGRLLLAQRKRREAIQPLRTGIVGLEATLGPGQRDTLIAKNALAGALHEVGDLEQAEPLYREALDGLDALYGPEHPDTLRLRFNYTMLLHSLGQVDEAIRSLQDQLVVRRRVLGPEHPDTLAVISNLAGMLQLAGRLDEAAPLCEEGLSKMEAVLPPEHPALQAMRVNLGALEKSRGRYERAEELLGSVYEARKRDLGPGAEATLQVLFTRAQLSRERGWQEQAEERARLGLRHALEDLGLEHPFTYEFERELGRVLIARREYEAAEAVLLRSIESRERALPFNKKLTPPDPELAALYRAWGKPDQAAAYADGE